jgi:hypothetical protein
MILVTVTLLLCAVIISAAAGVAPSFVIAQQEEEDTSLGEEDLTTPRIITVPQDITKQPARMEQRFHLKHQLKMI